jgi:hypothetical protein
MSEIRIQKTGEPDVIEASDGRLTLSVPIQIKRRSGRKLVTLPIDPVTGEPAKARPWDTATTPLQLALARGHRWLAMLESGEAKSLKEIAAREGIDNSYVSRMVNLTTLAPDIVAAILDDACPTTSRCLTWRWIRQRCGMTSAPGLGRPFGLPPIKCRQVPTLLAHE